jgi:hydroxyacylglutathione hydrolase
MALDFLCLTLGPLENNTYLLADSAIRQAVVIDPSFGSSAVLDTLAKRGWQLAAIWLTHAHFDHIAGVSELAQAFQPGLPIALHPADLPLYQLAGGAALFGYDLPTPPKPTVLLEHNQELVIGEHKIHVLHTPGHSPGHVVFSVADEEVVFCGDLIFYRGVGRTDLPGSSHEALLQSIRTHIFTLPPATLLFSGHGPETTVGDEIKENPFL